MKELVLPVPETVSATYIVPVPAPMSTVEARRQASKAVNARLTGPLRTLTAEWLAKGAVKVEMEPAGGLEHGHGAVPVATGSCRCGARTS
jgi:hypothetical protein